MRRWSAASAVATALALSACGDETTTKSTATSSTPATTAATSSTTAATSTTSDVAGEQRYPDVRSVEATRADDGSWAFAVTISSPYDSPERYADGWRVVGPDGEVYGTHQLMHDHAGEQPFTRTQRGVEIPDDVAEVTIEGRDQQYGFGGTTVTITLGG